MTFYERLKVFLFFSLSLLFQDLSGVLGDNSSVGIRETYINDAVCAGFPKATNSPSPRSRFYADLRVTGLFACSKTDIVTAGQLVCGLKVRCEPQMG
jgi:hypothetical protein